MSLDLTPHEVRAVAVRAVVDDRTVRRYLRGERMQTAKRRAVAQALEELGHRIAAA